MRRAFFFIVAIVFATTSYASIPRASMLDRASEDASPFASSLPETRIRVSEVLAPFERPHESELTRALRQAYEQPSTTNASGLRCFLSVDPTWSSADLTKPQSWNRYSYVLNNPINLTDADGKAWNDIFKTEWWTKKFNEWFPPKQVAADDPNREAVREAGYTDQQAERMANPAGAAQRGLNEAGGTLAAEGTKQIAVQSAVVAGPVLFRAALKPFNAELTQVGRALTKHPEVVGLQKSTLRTTLRSEAAINSAGADALKGILRNGVQTTVNLPRYGQVIQVQVPGGFGARWYADGRFIGFINP